MLANRYKVKYGYCVIDSSTGGVIFDFKGKRCHMNSAGLYIDETSVPWRGNRITLDDVVYQVAKQLEKENKDRTFLLKCFFTNDKCYGMSEDTQEAIGNKGIALDFEYQEFIKNISIFKSEDRSRILKNINDFIKILKESLKVT